MSDQSTSTRELQGLLDRLRAGDDAAREQLVAHACNRLRKLTRRLKSDFPVVKRYQQTDDIFQEAIVRLYRSLRDVQPENVRAFLGLAATQIRRELVDVARRLTGAEGLAANHDTVDPSAPHESGRSAVREIAADTDGPAELMLWTEFHEHADALPPNEREVFHLAFYQELPQVEIAELLKISLRTVKRRLRSAKELLHAALHDDTES